MKRILIFTVISIWAMQLQAQETAKDDARYLNSAERMLQAQTNLSIGGYGGVHYNQPLISGQRNNGKLDVHRFIMLMGYRFSAKTRFLSEIEFEHVEEVYIEQAFLQHQLTNSMYLRAGLVLIPMGIINEYHEPTTFFSVERPMLDKRIAPTTWREIGAGLNGTILGASLKYQLYVVNGFSGYDGGARFNGADALRGGRQKAAKSYISSPNLTGKVEYYGIRGLNIGLSAYWGNSQSKLYNGLANDQDQALEQADSSVVGISMLGLDARYSHSGWQVRGQLYYTALGNTPAYNEFTAPEAGQSNDLGSAMSGYYLETGYNVLKSFDDIEMELLPFVRYSQYNTHSQTAGELEPNKAYKHTYITAGLNWKLARGAVMKADVQWHKTAAENAYAPAFNAGFGIMF